MQASCHFYCLWGAACIVSPKWHRPPCQDMNLKIGWEFPNGEENLVLQGQMPSESLLRETLRVGWFNVNTHTKHTPSHINWLQSRCPPSRQHILLIIQLTNVSEMIKSGDGSPIVKRTVYSGRWRMGRIVRVVPVEKKIKFSAAGTVGSVCYLHSLVFPLPFHASVRSKMVERAAFRCIGKRGSLFRMEWRRKGRAGGGKRRCSGGRGEKGGQNQQQPLLLFLLCFSVLFFCQPCLTGEVPYTENKDTESRS